MAKFKDTAGHDWTPIFNVTLARHIRDTLEIDLLTLAGSGKSFAKMDSDRDLLAKVLWVVCGDAARQQGLDEAQFCERLAGEVFNRAIVAVRAAVVDFQAWREDRDGKESQPQGMGTFSTIKGEQGGNIQG